MTYDTKSEEFVKKFCETARNQEPPPSPPGTSCTRNMPIEWTTKPIDVKVGTYDADPNGAVNRQIREKVMAEFERAADATWNKPFSDVMKSPQDMALDDLRNQLADVRAERDRAQARNRELEARLQGIREMAK